MRKNILISGVPRSGKSTLLRKIIQRVDKKRGFVTNELRKDGERIGFEIETDSEERYILASVDFNTNLHVSKYCVDIHNLTAAIARVENFSEDDLLFVDEIGQMELFSEKFKALVLRYFDSKNTCIATISKVYSDEFIEAIKNRSDVILVELTEENREDKEGFIPALLRKIDKARRYSSEVCRFAVKKDEVRITTDHGTRILVNANNKWQCDCEFFGKNGICSHVLALEEYSKNSQSFSQI